VKDKRPVVAITMGDAAGIGPEITLKALEQRKLYDICRPVVLGDLGVMEQIRDICKSKTVFRKVSEINRLDPEFGTIDIIDYGDIRLKDFSFGRVSPVCGRAAVRYTVEAGKMAMEHRIGAMVSAPLNKASMREAGYSYEGQTQILGELTGVKKYGMILVLGGLRIMMYSTHMSLIDAINKISYEGMLDKIRLAREGLGFFDIKDPVIAVSAVNPHCGEGGLFGRQEIDIIEPAIRKAKEEGIDVRGPIPADIIFSNARNGDYDLVIAMYHDQANMAVKLLGFGSVVTLLAGLPIIRTSTGHGTAFDIAGKNMADETNLVKAIQLAAQLAAKKRSKDE
jgi:4-hydroxythreonine-4-phosphate dehydrogenase